MVNFWQKLPKPFSVLAPMDDVTDVVFRQMVLSIARPDVFFTEFVNCDGLIHGASGIPMRKLRYSSAEHPIVTQIWGTDPEKMGKAAKIAAKLGFDGIDINMGCPVRDVVKKGAGAGLIGNYELVEEIINAVKKGAGKVPVSVKTRLGKSQDIAKDWCTFLLKQDLAALTIHGRIAKQMSKGVANWKVIGEIVKIKNEISPGTLIIGNGDVKSMDDVEGKHKKFGVDGVMIGRGIFANPWVFSPTPPRLRGAGPTKEDYIKLFLRHINLFEKTWGKTKNFAIMKKFLKMYVNGFEGASDLRKKLAMTKNFAQMRKFLKYN